MQNDQLPQCENGETQHLSADLLFASHQTVWSKAAELLLNNQVMLTQGCPSSSLLSSLIDKIAVDYEAVVME